MGSGKPLNLPASGGVAVEHREHREGFRSIGLNSFGKEIPLAANLSQSREGEDGVATRGTEVGPGTLTLPVECAENNQDVFVFAMEEDNSCEMGWLSGTVLEA